MKILYTAFNGKTNSSKILLDEIDCVHKLYLKNSFTSSVTEFEKELANNYDFVVSFGQAPLDVDVVKIETTGFNDDKFVTNFDYSELKVILEQAGYKVMVSNNAGKYLCNNLYYYGLKYIHDNELNTRMLFIHIPKIKNITNIIDLANIFKQVK